MSSNRSCTDDLVDGFAKIMRQQVWRANGLMLLNATMVAIVVGVGAYVPRGRRHPLVRFLFLGASTLFLPIISDVAATVGSQYNTSAIIGRLDVVAAKCEPGIHIVLVLVWTGLVLVIAINTSAVVAGDEREGRNIDPPSDLLIKAFWLAYLMFSTASLSRFRTTRRWIATVTHIKSLARGVFAIFGLLYALTACKLLQRYLAFFLARRSVAFGRNPRLIVGYMAQLGEESHPPELVVKGEETVQVEELRSGYIFKGDETRRKGLVTLDRVWRSDGMLLRSAAPPKDLCFSFALFKLLRCRFAKYSVLEAGFTKVSKFFWGTYLQGDDYERVFRVITDELSFIHDYYYSSLPVSFSNSLIPLHNILISLLSIGYCLFIFGFIQIALRRFRNYNQIICYIWCPGRRGPTKPGGNGMELLTFGSNYFDAVPVFLVLSVVVLSEIKDIVAYVCSNWTKVYLVCKYVSNDSWQRSPLANRCIGFMFKYCRCKLVTPWDDKMNQCSVLMLHRPRRLLRLAERKKKVKVPREVKAAIFEGLKGEALHREQVMHIRPPSFPVSASTTGISGNAFSACHGQGSADTILAWHIATSIFEASNPQPLSDSKIAAIHLSRYCAYLVACRPKLLPDDDKWCSSLYTAVKKDADQALSNRTVVSTTETEYQQLVQLLSEGSKHEVVKNGVKLGKQLVDSKTGWEALARFWSEMILYVAPSDNLDGHAEAIASGGELITLVWALLAHAGIVDRLGVVSASTSCAAGNQV